MWQQFDKWYMFTPLKSAQFTWRSLWNDFTLITNEWIFNQNNPERVRVKGWYFCGREMKTTGMVECREKWDGDKASMLNCNYL